MAIFEVHFGYFCRQIDEKASKFKLNPFAFKELAETPIFPEFPQECTNLQLFPM